MEGIPNSSYSRTAFERTNEPRFPYHFPLWRGCISGFQYYQLAAVNILAGACYWRMHAGWNVTRTLSRMFVLLSMSLLKDQFWAAHQSHQLLFLEDLNILVDLMEENDTLFYLCFISDLGVHL